METLRPSRRIALAACAAVAMLTSTPVLADQAAAGTCAAALPAEAKLVYDAALPGVVAGGELRATIKAAAVALVKSSQLSRSSAKGAAEAAAGCLKQV